LTGIVPSDPPLPEKLNAALNNTLFPVFPRRLGPSVTALSSVPVRKIYGTALRPFLENRVQWG
jgi:hypothetical protein